jgi:hypothetical protein
MGSFFSKKDLLPLQILRLDDNNNNNNNLRYELLNSMKITEFQIEMEQFSQITCLEIYYKILSYLDYKTLCKIQQLSKFWYILGKDNNLWKNLTLSQSSLEKWNYLEDELKNYQNDLIKWKLVFRELYRLRYCTLCKKQFRKCFSNKKAFHHSGKRELIERPNGLPTGVYWDCCLVREKESNGCTEHDHF